MSTSRLFSVLDKALPDEKIIQDFSDRIWNDKELNGTYVELNNEWKFIPDNAPLDIVTKALFKEYFEIPFGTYKVMVAIGGNYKSGTWIFDSKILFCNALS
ncbi:hypothetical protein [Calothrix sp. CCY 0018]|uniref:hypothetical protein n=1 Tax=Calothrix sp. CCY 0018 TaxID=3103864 RepID=UPI0039C6F971